MKKVFTLITFFVLLLNYSNGQVRLTEVSPITTKQTPKRFFELFFYTEQSQLTNNSSFYDGYRMIVYTKSSSQERVIIGKMNLTPGNTDIFSASSILPAATSFTPGVVTVAESLQNVQTSNPAVEYSWSTIFSSVTEFARSGSGWGTLSNNGDIFPDISTNDKIAVLIFKPGVAGQNDILVDVVADFAETGNLIKTLPPINDNAAIGINFSSIKIAPEKFVNQALGVNNPYQIERKISANKGKSSTVCELKWNKIAVETPGEILGFNTNITTWAVKYFIKNKTDGANQYSIDVSQTSDISNSPSVYEVNNDNGGKDIKVNMRLEVYNLTNWSGDIELFKQHFLTSVYNDIPVVNQLYNIDNTGKSIFDPILVSDAKLVPPTPSISNVTNVGNDVSFTIEFTTTPSTARLGFFTTLDGLTGENCFSLEKYFAITPQALPVSFGNLDVIFHSNKSLINWKTLSEQNNKGFEVQRSIGNTNDFKTIGFVGTRAKDGNSQTEISYSFEDTDVKPGQTHFYRLNQIDFDGKSAFSPVKSIKPGSIESNLNVYPNPSQGSFTVTTGSASGKLNIFVMDNTGRVVNQYMNVSTTNTKISNLKKGFYTLKIVNTESGEQSAQRVVVQ